MRKEQYKTFTVDGEEMKYICRQMPATMALKAQVEVVDIIGQPALVAISKLFGDGLDGQFDDAVGAVTSAITRKLTPDKATQLAFVMLNGVRCENVGDLWEQDVFDEHFRGRILHLYAVVLWSIGVNYADFFAAARSHSVIGDGLKTAKEALKLLMQMLQSGVSAKLKEDSTSETS